MFIQKEWDQMPSLSESQKELISLGSWSLYRIDGKLLMIIPGGCKCCHGDRETSYWFLKESGEVDSQAPESFYKSGKVDEIIKFKIPEYLTKNYLKISI